jgi:hypothetical protein
VVALVGAEWAPVDAGAFDSDEEDDEFDCGLLWMSGTLSERARL